MIIEQVRYFVSVENRDQTLAARREIARLRRRLSLPPGRILLADPVPDDAPVLIWQCAYEDDAMMGAAEAALLGNPDYEAARTQLGGIVSRVEVEIYTSDDEDDQPDQSPSGA